MINLQSEHQMNIEHQDLWWFFDFWLQNCVKSLVTKDYATVSKDALLEMIKALQRASPICHNLSQAPLFFDFSIFPYFSQVGQGWSSDIYR